MGITVTVTTAPEFVNVEPGTYKAKLTKLDAGTGPYGEHIKWTFTITDPEDEWDGQAVTCITSMKATAIKGMDSKLYRWYQVLSGTTPEVDEKLVLDTLLGKSCIITVISKTNAKGNTFSNVADISPDRKSRKPAVATVAPARVAQPTRRRSMEEEETDVPF